MHFIFNSSREYWLHVASPDKLIFYLQRFRDPPPLVEQFKHWQEM